MKAWTDYPITALGDAPQQEAPIRECVVLAYDGNKYLTVNVGGVRLEVKEGYVYTRRGRAVCDPRWQWSTTLGHNFRLSDGGSLRRAPCLSPKQLRGVARRTP